MLPDGRQGINEIAAFLLLYTQEHSSPTPKTTVLS